MRRRIALLDAQRVAATDTGEATMTRIPGPRTNWNDLTSFDYLSLSQRERDEIRREAVRLNSLAS